MGKTARFSINLLVVKTVAAVFIFIAAYLVYFFSSLPNVNTLSDCIVTKLFKVSLCKNSPAYTPLSQISPYMIGAVIVSEDGNFYHHNGFDFDEIQNSFEKNLKNFAFSRGGSTISQQLVKNVFLTNEKTITRKIREAILTYQLEQTFKKNIILEKYLNVVEFGPNLYGITAAANFYFKKSPHDLSIMESAYLTHLLPNPKSYSKGFYKKSLTVFNQKRILVIAHLLLKYKKISEEQYQTSIASLANFPWDGSESKTVLDAEINSKNINFEKLDEETDSDSDSNPDTNSEPNAESDTNLESNKKP